MLTSEGARVNPEWLKGFLANPALSTTDTNRDGVRSYLQVRMPTFYFSDDEIRSLVLFFGAMSHQAAAVHPAEARAAHPGRSGAWRAQLFTSTAAPCLKCHATGDPAHDKNATAPNFLLAKDRLRPAWTERWITNPQLIAPGHGHAFGPVQAGGRPLGIRRPVPAELQWLQGRPRRLAGALHVPAHARGAARAARAHSDCAAACRSSRGAASMRAYAAACKIRVRSILSLRIEIVI